MASTRQRVKLGFAVTAAVALLGYWLGMTSWTGEFIAAVIVNTIMVLATATTVVALMTAWRGETTPEWSVLVLLFAGGVAVLVALIVSEPAWFSLGVAVFAAGAVCIGEAPRASSSATKRKRAAT